MSSIELFIEGLGFWGDGLPDWDATRGFVRDGALPEAPPARPVAALLPPNERRRAPDTVALALQVAQAACADAGRDPKSLPSVFASTHGDIAITDYMCETLAADPRAISPTRFHNSVHNAAAGYWTIGVGCMAPATALSAYTASFAQGLLESAAQVAAGEGPVLLVAYDAQARGPLARLSRSEGLLGAAFVLGAEPARAKHRLRVSMQAGVAPLPSGALARRYAANAMLPMLPLIEALADGTGAAGVALIAGPEQHLRVEVDAWPQ